MDLQLRNKIVIVTGGARGIGAATVRALAREGAAPVIAGRDTHGDAERLLSEMRSQGAPALSVTADLCEPDNCRAVIEAVVEKFGRVDGLVNNAGINDGVGLENGSPERFAESIRKNLLHYYDVAHFALEHLKRSAGAAIVNVGSKTAETGQGGTSGYAASKGGINALTREWAVELSRYGIRVNCVVPAEVWTPQYEQWINSFPDAEEKLNVITSRIPLGQRMTTADEIATAVVYLLSPASGHTTGQLIHVDGGYVHLDRALGR